MFSPVKLTTLLLIVAQIFGAINGGVYDNIDKWVFYYKTQEFPDNAVIGGYDTDGYDNFVGRVAYASSILPARIRGETGYCTFNNERTGISATSFEVLVANETVSYHWVRSFDGYGEKNAVSVGTNSVNERVYICRARTDGGMFIGTLYPSLRACIIRYETLPLRNINKYEVLVRKPRFAAIQPFVDQIN